MTKVFAAFNFFYALSLPPSPVPVGSSALFVTVSVSFTESRNSIFKVTHNTGPVSVLTRKRTSTYIHTCWCVSAPHELCPLTHCVYVSLGNVVCFIKISSTRWMIHFTAMRNDFTPLVTAAVWRYSFVFPPLTGVISTLSSPEKCVISRHRQLCYICTNYYWFWLTFRFIALYDLNSFPIVCGYRKARCNWNLIVLYDGAISWNLIVISYQVTIPEFLNSICLIKCLSDPSHLSTKMLFACTDL